MDINQVNNTAAQALAIAATAINREQPAQNREMIQAVKAVNEAELFGDDTELTFLMDRETKRPLFRLVDRKTGEVIRQIPPEYLLRLAEDLDRQQDHK